MSENQTYYEKNKIKILSSLSEKIKCEICDKYYAKSSFLQHMKSVKHKKNTISIKYKKNVKLIKRKENINECNNLFTVNF